MRNIVRTSISIALCVILSACATPVVKQDGAFVQVFGESHTISSNSGGTITVFQSAADEVRRKGWQVRIDGICLSACAAFADEARPNICITKNAVFGFHKVTNTSYFAKTSSQNGLSTRQGFVLTTRSNPPVSPDIGKWVEEHGGFPTEGFLYMDKKEDTSAFWPECK